ncbi:intracellular hyphae protein 1 [Colletotrichum higginsianum]|uniref:Secreted LysM effector ELP2 n=2 Tax=Colletotrichum higginsianum TaxID=80884 RepID=LYSM2_COLHI|nr:EC90a protein [Colletotrichum higginsianum IMI 349063]TID07662.1 Intracellular hyphae protein 1 [Colletotrichum higginsianum]OBR10321.1 EC90a protein [Colletotrichum higginsianum IMI 349063]CCF31974.1 intracellular hyphae protein 1 [Colletotrichum higginsianum]CCF70973.1 EC90a protein [Colletotrichum higginsianum]GJD02668.1 EC90a protein [Colletotrichum higginsianum]
MQFSIFTVLAAAASFAVALPVCDATTTATTTSAAANPSPTTSGAANPSPTCGKLGDFHKTTVKAGQTLTTIAERFHSGICDIAWQNKLENPNVIFVGQVLLVPVNVCNPDNTSCLVPVGEATCVTGGPATYTIKSGDTFFAVAQSLGITTDSLTGANPGVVPENLQIDQVINVPVC